MRIGLDIYTHTYSYIHIKNDKLSYSFTAERNRAIGAKYTRKKKIPQKLGSFSWRKTAVS